MHELALARSIVDEIMQVMARERVERVSRVVIELGSVAGVAAEALRFGFEVAVKSTALEGAALEIERVPNSRAVRLKALEAETLD